MYRHAATDGVAYRGIPPAVALARVLRKVCIGRSAVGQSGGPAPVIGSGRYSEGVRPEAQPFPTCR
eukprot:COSAG03_NODE_18530_length_353_cov_0.795276_1_plen_65_part_10